MAKTQTSQRDEKQELTRRALIKWSVAAGAALGVSRSKIYEVLEKTAGKGVAFAASEQATTRSIHLIAGNGGLAWFTLFWPQVDVAKARNPNFSWHKTGMEQDVAGTPNPLVIGPDTPWASLPAARQVTGFLSGQNETHTGTPVSTGQLGGNSIYAIASALQAGAPSVVPVVSVGNARLGTAPGSLAEANVANADGIVGLFNSAASRAGGLLSKMADAQLYTAQYNALIQFEKIARSPSAKAGISTAANSASLLGVNLAARLQVNPEDLTRYGITGNTRNNVAAIGRNLIVAVKAFSMGLCNTIIMPAMNDDPHGAFDSGDVNTVPAQLKAIFDAFMADASKTTDPDGTTIADDVVFTITGDTPKAALNKNGWGDGTNGGSNQVFVYSAGHLNAGWYGSIDRTGKVAGFGADGKAAAYNAGDTAKYAMASIAYAITKRDERAISAFAPGLKISGVFGKSKDK